MFIISSIIKNGSIPLLLCMFLSCAGLKKSQVTAVEKFSHIAKGISAIPPDLYYRVYQLRAQTQTLQLSGVIATNQSAKESIEALQLDLNDKLKFLNMADSFGSAYKIMYMYTEMLQGIVTPGYLKDFSKNKKEWETSFNVLVKTYSTASGHMPAATPFNKSVGSITAAIIKAAGSAKIKSLQKKYLKTAITEAQEPFEAICGNFITIDIPRIKNELAALPSFINENYKDFLNNIQAYEIKQGNSPYNYYKHYLPVYLNWQLELKELNTLIQQLEICFTSLRNAFKVLNQYLAAGNLITTAPAELTVLEDNYAVLRTTLAKFSDSRERMFKIYY
jgi:hypothetical protein